MSYGYCPMCFAPSVTRERRMDGNDTCRNQHDYPSARSLTWAQVIATETAGVKLPQGGGGAAQHSLDLKVEKLSPQPGEIVVVTCPTSEIRNVVRQLATLRESLPDVQYVVVPEGYSVRVAPKD